MAQYKDLLDEALLKRIQKIGYDLKLENDSHEKGITFSFHKKVGHYIIVLNLFFDHKEDGIISTKIDLFEEEPGQFPAFIDSDGHVSGLRGPCIIVHKDNGSVDELLEEWNNEAIKLADHYNNIHDKILTARKYSSLEAESLKYSNTIVKQNDVGGDVPCPCGSGKKYKHCCSDL